METIEKNALEKIEKPSFVYHGSSNRNIEEFVPSNKKIRDLKEGPVVFATQDIGLASTFMIGSDDSWTNIGKMNNVPYIVIGDEERFKNFDKGGSIYKLSGNSFHCDLNKGMGKNEWTSRDPVRPVEKIDFDSVLEAMIDNGVQVYFLSKEDFEDYKKALTGNEKLEKLLNMTSENEKRGKNVIKFE